MAPKESSSQSTGTPKDLPPLPDDLNHLIDFTTMTASTVRYAHYYTIYVLLTLHFSFSPRTVTNNAGGSPVTVHMELGKFFRIISLFILILFLDDPEPEAVVLNAEGIA